MSNESRQTIILFSQCERAKSVWASLSFGWSLKTQPMRLRCSSTRPKITDRPTKGPDCYLTRCALRRCAFVAGIARSGGHEGRSGSDRYVAVEVEGWQRSVEEEGGLGKKLQ